jgi:hypothetical protein
MAPLCRLLLAEALKQAICSVMALIDLMNLEKRWKVLFEVIAK